MAAPAILIRIARQRLDGERRALGALGARALALETQLRELRERRQEEIGGLGPSLEESALLGRWLEGVRRHERRLAAEARHLDHAREAQLVGLLARRAEIERLELVAARRARREAMEAARREQRELDDLVGARAARPDTI